MAIIDLSSVPAPTIVEQLSFDTIKSEILAGFRALYPEYAELLDSDPVIKILEAAAYREILVRQRVNDACRGVMLAYAVGSDLDQIGSLFGVTRNTITAADPVNGVEAVMEGDASFRQRVQLSLESLSVAGPANAYVSIALGVADVLDVAVSSPDPGDVEVVVLSREGDGTPSSPLLAEISALLSSDDVRPLTDNVSVIAATIVEFTVEATVYTYSGPDPSVILADSAARLEAFLEDNRKVGRTVPLSGILAALHASGVQRVVLAAPEADVEVDTDEAGYCTAVTITNGGIVGA